MLLNISSALTTDVPVCHTLGMSTYEAVGQSLLTLPEENVSETVTRSDSSLLISSVLKWDERISRKVYDASYNNSRTILILLEASGHLGLWVALPVLWFFFKPDMSAPVAASVLNYMTISLLDLIVIALLKPIVRRSRPQYNGGLTHLTIDAIDQYSFPSGHATRAGLNAAYIAYLQVMHPRTLYPFMNSKLFLFIISLWAAAVAVSRVALGRHHVIDVAVGLLIGVINVAIWHHFWIPAPTAESIRNSIRAFLGLYNKT